MNRAKIAAALATLLGVGCGDDPMSDASSGVREPSVPPPHVVVVCIDTLRVDHTSLGGYARATTPGLERIAASGTTFARHFANAPWTKPSVATLLTGLLPPAHGAQWGDFNSASKKRPVDVLPAAFETLPERLSRAGFATHGFMTNSTLTENLGFAQGFDEYVLIEPTLAGDEESIERTKRTLDAATGPTFVWCHMMAPHNYQHRPAQPNFKTPKGAGGRMRVKSSEPGGGTLIGNYRLRTRERAIDIYDETILFADRLVEGLFEHVSTRHPNTLLIVTSDHGEEFGEHGGWLHGRTLYNEMLRVPLVVWGPGIEAGKVVREITNAIDLFPTILSKLGLEAGPDLHGTSLFATERPGVYAEMRNGQGAKQAWVLPSAKWIASLPASGARSKPSMEGPATWERFVDPFAIEDLGAAVTDGAGTDEVRAEMDAHHAAARALFEARTSGSETSRQATDADLEALRALGYTE